MKAKIKGYLPGFNGFYNSLHEFDDDRILDYINEDRRENNLPEFDIYDISFSINEDFTMSHCYTEYVSNYNELITMEIKGEN